MPRNSDCTLPLPNFSIQRFRGINDLWLPKLGRVTLLTGTNGIGKTTVLEAARIWATRGSKKSVIGLLTERGEICVDEDGRLDQQDGLYIKNLFWGRTPKPADRIIIGPKGSSESELLNIRYIPKMPNSISSTRRKFGKSKSTTAWSSLYEGNSEIDLDIDDAFTSIDNIQFNSLGPGTSSTRKIVEYWTKIALTPNENRAVKALNIVAKDKIERVAVVGEKHTQKIIAKTERSDIPVPLMSLGNGVTRFLGVALAMPCSQGGFLFLDEAENGIHYSALTDFWRMVLQAAHDNDVQVIATTHSFDCVKGFANAAVENEEVEGVLVRIEDSKNGLGAVTFDESDLEIVAADEIEVR